MPINHPSKTPTLASEQRNARPPQPPQRRLAQKWPDCRPVASGLESHSLEPKKVTTTTISRPPHLPKREKWKNKPQTPGVPLEESIGSILKLPLGREGAFKAWWGQLNARLVDQLPAVWLIPQASSDYLSTARLLRRSRQTCYIYNHTCSTTTRERESSSQARVDSWVQPFHHRLLPPEQQSIRRCSRPRRSHWQFNSRRRVTTKKSTQWKPTWSWRNAHNGSRVRPSERAWNTSTPPAAIQLLTQNPRRLFRWCYFSSETGRARGD